MVDGFGLGGFAEGLTSGLSAGTQALAPGREASLRREERLAKEVEAGRTRLLGQIKGLEDTVKEIVNTRGPDAARRFVQTLGPRSLELVGGRAEELGIPYVTGDLLTGRIEALIQSGETAAQSGQRAGEQKLAEAQAIAGPTPLSPQQRQQLGNVAIDPMKAPTTREVKRGDRIVTEEWDAPSAQWRPVGTSPRAQPRDPGAPEIREFKVNDQIVTRQWNPQAGLWETLETAPRSDTGAGGPTLAQQANNTEIDAARRALDRMGLSREDLIARMEPSTATGRANAVFDPQVDYLIRAARQRKVGDDPDYERFAEYLSGTKGMVSPLPMRDGALDAGALRPGSIYSIDDADGNPTPHRWTGTGFVQVVTDTPGGAK